MEIIIGIAIYLLIGILVEIAVIFIVNDFNYDVDVLITIAIWPLLIAGCIAMTIANFINDIITKCKGEK
jgi:hypothetical protein